MMMPWNEYQAMVVRLCWWPFLLFATQDASLVQEATTTPSEKAEPKRFLTSNK
jgi:hypothetical protein